MHAEREMHRRLHLSPKGAEARTIVDILNDGDGRQVASGDVIVPLLARRDGRSRFFFGADQTRTREADDWRQFAIRRDHELNRETDRSTLWDDKFQAVADGRRVPCL